MLRPIPKFIYSKANQIFMVLFVPFFALVFINLYRPLDFDRIDDSFLRAFDISREARVQLITMMMVFGGMVIAAVSRAIMWLYAKKSTMTYIGYILWIFGELLAMATAFTLATLLTDTTRTVTELFKNSFVKTFLIVFIPYALCYIYFIWQENMRELSALRKQIERDETVLQKAYVQILDEKGEMRLSVRRENLLLIESADNYVCVYYLNGDKTKKTMVRNTLSRVAEHLQGSRVVRCHRSYMINLEHAKVMHRDKEGVFVELGIEGVPDVPISRTYADNIREWIVDNN